MLLPSFEFKRDADLTVHTSQRPDAAKKRVFISYSRKDSAIAQELSGLLAREGFEPKLDTKEIVAGEDWRRRLESLIRNADAVVFVISPDSIRSEHCLWEITRTLELKKVLVPLLWRKTKHLPLALSAIQFVAFDAYDSNGIAKRDRMASMIRRLAGALDIVDTLWAREHTKWVSRAAEWDTADPPRPKGGLLRSGDIASLQTWARLRPRNAPDIPDVLTDYLAASEEQDARDREIERRETAARATNEAKSAFLANNAHELRTPLNAIVGFSEIMAKELFGPIGNQQYLTFARDIYDAGSHLIDIVDDILDTAKLDAGHFILSLETLDPAEPVSQALRLVRRRAEEKGLTVLSDVERLPPLVADRRAVLQMALNLLSNAVKFTDSGGILVRTGVVAEGLSITVVDTGRGMPAEFLRSLGRRFQLGEGHFSREHAGIGLGVALCKGLALAHGGCLEYDSVEGEGTIATVHLPLQATPSPEQQESEGEAPVRIGVALLGATRERVYAQLRQMLLETQKTKLEPTPMSQPPASPTNESAAQMGEQPTMDEIISGLRALVDAPEDGTRQMAPPATEGQANPQQEIASRLEERLAFIEVRSAQAIEQAGAKLVELAERMEARQREGIQNFEHTIDAKLVALEQKLQQRWMRDLMRVSKETASDSHS